MGVKSHDYCVARLCQRCHIEMDNYAKSNDEERQHQFVTYILGTITFLHNTYTLRINREKELTDVLAKINYKITSSHHLSYEKFGLLKELKSYFVELDGVL